MTAPGSTMLCPPEPRGELARTHLEVQHLAAVVGWLQASLRPGTSKPWRQPTVSARTRAELDARARDERRERVGLAPGETPAPYDLDVSDLLTAVHTAAGHLAGDVGRHHHHVPRAPGELGTVALLQYVEVHLGTVTDPVLLGSVRRVCAGLTRRGWLVLGLVVDGQLLDAVCPWCSGRTDANPVGGDRTLRVRTEAGRRGDTPRPVVVCEGGACAPSEAHCGTHWRGLPAWDLFTEGDWLARCINSAADVATCPCGQPAFRSGTGRGRPAVYCSEQCRRDAERTRRATPERAATGAA